MSIKKVLMERDGMTSDEANADIEAARANLHERLAKGEMPFSVCEEWFGLEEDYIEELI